MSEVATNSKLDTPLKMKVFAMMARGEKYGTIQRVLKEHHNIDYSQQSLSDLKKRHKDTISEMHSMILQDQASDAENIRAKSLRLLSRRLDQANADEVEIAKVDDEYRNGDMSLSEYRRKKAGLLKVSIKELTEVSKEMTAQSKHAGTLPGRLPAGANGDEDSGGSIDPKFAEALSQAIARGDTVALQQLVIQPNA